MKKYLLIICCCLLSAVSVSLFAEQKGFVTSMRADKAIDEPNVAPEFSQQEQSPTRRVRDYPMQPPTVPHSIEGMMVTKDMNQCLICHNSQTAPQMKAPAVALSHYLTRDDEYLSEVSPRRYFCTQCHVPQSVKPPVVRSTF